MKKLPIIMMIGMLFVHSRGETETKTDSPKILFEAAQEEIFQLKFHKAYGILSDTLKMCPDCPYKDETIILKNIISLAQTFSNLRLYSAYDKGASSYKVSSEDPLSPLMRLMPYRREYLKRTKTWLERLVSDTIESLEIPQEVELSLKYPGTNDLPYFVRAGIDTLANVKKGIPPTPSQAQNIEESESYASVLSVIYLCVQQEFELPRKAVFIEGKVILKVLIYYSNLWISKAITITGAAREVM